jgi:hypothetical protein
MPTDAATSTACPALPMGKAPSAMLIDTVMYPEQLTTLC